jgi:PAS domain S-box-containing protein
MNDDIPGAEQTIPQERESLWRTLFHHAPFGIAINRLDDGLFIDVNPAYEGLSGRSRDEVLGRCVWEFLPPAAREESRRALRRLKRDGRISNQEVTVRRKDGTMRHVLYSAATFHTGEELHAVSMFIDIDDLKRAKQALQQSRDMLQSLFQAVPVGLTILKNRTFLSVNERLGEIVGCDAAELLNSSSRQLYESEEEYARVGERLYASLWQEGKSYVETRFVRRDGSVRDVSLFAAPIDPGNPEAGAAVAIQDISDHKRTLTELSKSEARFRTIADFTGQLVYDYDVSTGVILWAGRSRDITGYSMKEMNSQGFSGWMDHVHPDDRGRILAHLETARRNRGVFAAEYRYRRADGSYMYVEEEGAYLYDVEGNATRMLGVIRDISERKVAEETLRESEFRFRSFFNTNPEGILLIDFQGTILDANRAFLRESGYELSECISRKFSELVPERDHARIIQAIVSLKSGVSHQEPLEFSCIAKNGAHLPVAAKGWLVVDDRSAPLYLGMFIRNLQREKALTEEQAALEKQVIQAQKNEAIGTLAGGIAHDFNNILGGIIGYTELALLHLPAAGDNRAHDYLQRVLEAGNRARDLVRQILRFSRPGSITMEPISLTPLIKESIRLLRSTLPATITISQRLDADNDLIMGDPTQIHQVVMNLCTNAYHAMRETGGVLTISLEQADLMAPREFLSMRIEPGAYLKLAVADTGSGIPPAILERIFEPYFTTKQVNEGTGLGLAVTMGIVKSHQGLIEVETTSGHGTCFTLFLPVTTVEAVRQPDESAVLPLGHGERVLVVDDESFFLEVVRDSLTLLGYRVTACGSSLECLETFRNNAGEYHLLITDQTMPEMTGVQLIQEIRAIGATLPVILCTGYSETVIAQTIAYYGITRLLMKPVSIDELARTVDDVLGAAERRDDGRG